MTNEWGEQRRRLATMQAESKVIVAAKRWRYIRNTRRSSPWRRPWTGWRSPPTTCGNTSMTDMNLVERLRDWMLVDTSGEPPYDLLKEAADEIERLQYEIDNSEYLGDDDWECPTCGRVLGTVDGVPTCDNCGWQRAREPDGDAGRHDARDRWLRDLPAYQGHRDVPGHPNHLPHGEDRDRRHRKRVSRWARWITSPSRSTRTSCWRA